jgi:hypothetical protein
MSTFYTNLADEPSLQRGAGFRALRAVSAHSQLHLICMAMRDLAFEESKKTLPSTIFAQCNLGFR